MRFEKYFVPSTLKECFELLGQYGESAKILAGGTDLVPLLKNKMISPAAVIDLRKIPGLGETKITAEGLELGAMARLRELSLNKALAADYRIIAEAAGRVSSIQVRNVATIGGNACNAFPGADAIHGLMLSDAIAVIQSGAGSREVPIAQFFVGPEETVLKTGEVLTGFKVPKPVPRTGAHYEKFAIRGDIDISIVGAGAAITLAGDGTVAGAVISLGSVAPTPLRVPAVEKMLVGAKLTPELIERAAKAASQSVTPISDQRASAEYRVEIIRVSIKQALTKALERASGKGA